MLLKILDDDQRTRRAMALMLAGATAATAILVPIAMLLLAGLWASAGSGAIASTLTWLLARRTHRRSRGSNGTTGGRRVRPKR